MRSPHNALTATIASLGLTDSVQENTHEIYPGRWHLKIVSLPHALIHSHLIVEVIEEEDGDASVCVLQRKNVGRRVMTRILDCLCEALDDEDDLISDQPSVPPPSRGASPPPQQ